MLDLLVLGGGPAGVTAALRAREFGVNVGLVEASKLGGTCHLHGCVPVRVLAQAARLMRDARSAPDFGIRGIADPLTVDSAALLEHARAAIEDVSGKKRLAAVLSSAGVELHEGAGPARFTDAHTVQFPDGRTLKADRFILAVGGRPRRLECPGAELAIYVPQLWQLKTLPRSVVMIGGGSTGLQLASTLATLGVKVTLLEAAERVMPGADAELCDALAIALQRQGVDIHTGLYRIERIETIANTAPAMLRLHGALGDGGIVVEAQCVIAAAGWPGNADQVNPAAAGIELDADGHARVNEFLQTTGPTVFAAGDANGRSPWVQGAFFQANVAAENAVLGPRRAIGNPPMPIGGFTDPEFGWVGLTQSQAEQRGHRVAIAIARYSELDRAAIDRRTEGFCKLVLDRPTRRLLGAHVVGELAAEVVQIAAVAMGSDATLEQLAELQFAYPTYPAIFSLAIRRLARDLGLIPVYRPWPEPGEPAEWEKRR